MKTFEQFIREHKAKSIDWLGEEKMQKYHISLAEAVELVDMWQKLQQTPCYAGRQAAPLACTSCGMTEDLVLKYGCSAHYCPLHLQANGA